MAEKPLTIIVYLLIGGFVILSPLVIRAWQGEKHAAFTRLNNYPYLAGIVLLGIAAWVAKIAALGNHRLAMSWVICACLAALAARKKWAETAIGGALGLAIAAVMPWWRYNGLAIDAPRHDLTLYALIDLAALALLVRQLAAPPSAALPRSWKGWAIVAFVPFALYLSFTTGMAENWQTFGAWWHHWGAYVGPAELMLSGAHVLRDFPVQYGLGPTVLIAAACRTNCWVTMYYIVGLSTFLMALLVLCIALSLGIRSRFALIVLPVATIVTCFFWNSYGPEFSSPLLFPSVAGLRFTPVVLLVAALCLIESDRRWAGRWQWIGHGLWAMGAVWSPEMLYAVSFVWWPYYCWRSVAGLEWKRVFFAFVTAIARLLLVLVIVLAGFLAVYAIAYHDVPSGIAWLAYMLYPPGPVPINPKGPVWWYGAVLVLGFAALFRLYRADGDSIAFRRSLLVVLMGYAVLSYCMGRSHDNNFLNLAPFALLIIVGAFGSNLPVAFRALGAGLLASMIGWIVVFGWGIWRDDYQAGRLFEFAPTKVTNSFAYTDPAGAMKLRQTFSEQKMAAGNPDDAGRAIAEITQRSGEQVTIQDHASIVVEGGPRNVWDAFHSTAIYVYLPQEWRTRFLVSTEKHFHKSGWVIADKTYDVAPWLESYEAAYDLVGEEDFGTYHAYHFVPKATP